MSAPWTPGPWAPFWDDIPHSDMGEGWTVNSPEHSVAICDGPADVNEANARLIAAAPALYEALEQISRYPDVREYVGTLCHDKALAALTLARGESGQ